LASVAILTPLLQSYCSSDFNYSLDNGSWLMRAFNGTIPAAVSGSLNVTLYPLNFTAVGATRYSVLREGVVVGECSVSPSPLEALNVGLSATGSIFAAAAALDCPNPPSLTLIQPPAQCASSGTITLEAVSNATTFTWSGPGIDDGNRNLQNPPIARIPSNSGTYVCVASSGPGCFASRSVNVVIHSNPAPALVEPLIQVCATSTIVEPGIGAGGDGLRWHTSATATSPFSTTLSMPVGTPVTYYVATVNNSTGCESARSQVVINVAPKPTVVGAENATSSSARLRWRRAPLWVTNAMAPYGAFEAQYIQVAPTLGSWQTLPIIADTTVLLTGLQTGGTYQFRVRYQCLSGFSVYSDTTVVSRFSTQSGCLAPSIPTTSPAGSGNRNVNWSVVSGALSYVCGYGLITANPSTWPSVLSYTNSVLLTGLNPTLNCRARVFTNCVNATNLTNGPGTSPWTSTSATFKPNARTAVDGMADWFNLSVYPNPCKGSFNVSFDSDTETEVRMEIFDLAGRSVYQKRQNVVLGRNEWTPDTQLPDGMYILRCQTAGGRWQTKIIVER
jgi:hypothetical protein